MQQSFKYPDSAEFAFTILDDTDDTTVANGCPIYDLLDRLDIRISKTVWAWDAPPEKRGPYFKGETLSSPEYLQWVGTLADKGFEIAFHNATMGSSERSDTIKALDFIERELGKPVRLHCNHGQNRENLYWGRQRYSSMLIKLANAVHEKFSPGIAYEGNDIDSPYYWADVAMERLSYLRSFTFNKLNCAKIPPGRPYIDTMKRNTPLLFNTADAPDVAAFNKLVTVDSINQLRRQGGWAIISTHFGKGFFNNGVINSQFKEAMEYLATQPGWYVPVTTLLDFIAARYDKYELSRQHVFYMECLHVIDRLKKRFNHI